MENDTVLLGYYRLHKEERRLHQRKALMALLAGQDSLLDRLHASETRGEDLRGEEKVRKKRKREEGKKGRRGGEGAERRASDAIESYNQGSYPLALRLIIICRER